MYRLTILYGKPDDPEHFRRHYRDVHIPLARRMRGLTGWTLSWIDETVPATDADADRWILVAELYAPDRAAMQAVLDSPEGRAASADLAEFVTGGVQFLWGEEEQVELS